MLYGRMPDASMPEDLELLRARIGIYKRGKYTSDMAKVRYFLNHYSKLSLYAFPKESR